MQYELGDVEGVGGVGARGQEKAVLGPEGVVVVFAVGEIDLCVGGVGVLSYYFEDARVVFDFTVGFEGEIVSSRDVGGVWGDVVEEVDVGHEGHSFVGIGGWLGFKFAWTGISRRDRGDVVKTSAVDAGPGVEEAR